MPLTQANINLADVVKVLRLYQEICGGQWLAIEPDRAIRYQAEDMLPILRGTTDHDRDHRTLGWPLGSRWAWNGSKLRADIDRHTGVIRFWMYPNLTPGQKGYDEAWEASRRFTDETSKIEPTGSEQRNQCFGDSLRKFWRMPFFCSVVASFKIPATSIRSTKENVERAKGYTIERDSYEELLRLLPESQDASAACTVSALTMPNNWLMLEAVHGLGVPLGDNPNVKEIGVSLLEAGYVLTLPQILAALAAEKSGVDIGLPSSDGYRGVEFNAFVKRFYTFGGEASNDVDGHNYMGDSEPVAVCTFSRTVENGVWKPFWDTRIFCSSIGAPTYYTGLDRLLVPNLDIEKLQLAR